MLRAVLLGVLAIGTAACGKSSTETSAAKSQPGVAAGKVLEVKGTVSVKHAGATRPLAVGESVEGDDTVITGADGNVVIELAHNAARWELGPNKQQQVNQSIAWKAQKATAEDVDQATAAAGRPAERNAAGTVATADEAPAEPAPEMKKQADDIAGAPGAAPSPVSPSAPARPARSRSAVAPPPPPPAAEPAGLVDDAPPEGTRRTRGAIRKEAALDAPSGGGAMAPADGAAMAPAAAPAPVTAPAKESVAASNASLVAAKATALHQCLVDAKATTDVTVTVDFASGKPVVKLSGASTTPALQTCIQGVIAGIHFTGADRVTRVVKP